MRQSQQHCNACLEWLSDLLAINYCLFCVFQMGYERVMRLCFFMLLLVAHVNAYCNDYSYSITTVGPGMEGVFDTCATIEQNDACHDYYGHVIFSSDEYKGWFVEPMYLCCYCGGGYQSTTPSCSPGTAIDSSNSCVDCEAGKYKSSYGTSACTLCPEHKTSPVGSDSGLDCFCDDGYEGKPGTSDTCTACPLGKYFHSSLYTDYQESSCRDCTSGKYAGMQGMSACMDCPANMDARDTHRSYCECVEGAEKQSSSCELCPVGSYKSLFGNSPCISCNDDVKDHLTTVTVGSASAEDCLCEAGYEGDIYNGCWSCFPGTYSSILGGSCGACPLENQWSWTAATECACNAGYELWNGQCVGCIAGKYKDTIADSTCLQCGQFQTTFVSGGGPATSREQCGCLAGYTSELDSPDSLCSACPRGKYQIYPFSGQSCHDCASGGTTAMDASAYVWLCIPNAGYYKVDTNSFLPCPANTYRAYTAFESADLSIASCLKCPDKTKSVQGSVSQTDCGCLPPEYSTGTPPCTCALGYSLNVTGQCEMCGSGFYCFNEKRYACPYGSTSPQGSSSVQNCECVGGWLGSSADHFFGYQYGCGSEVAGYERLYEQYPNRAGQPQNWFVSWLVAYFDSGWNVSNVNQMPQFNNNYTATLMECARLCTMDEQCVALTITNEWCFFVSNDVTPLNLGSEASNPWLPVDTPTPIQTSYPENRRTYSKCMRCVSCDENSFWSGGICVACPANTRSAPYSTDASQCLAAPGYYMQGSVVVKCPLGSTSLGAGTSIINCTAEPGFYNNGIEIKRCVANSNSSFGSTNISDCVCLPGYEGFAGSGGSCGACAEEYYKPLLEDGWCTRCRAHSSTGFYGSTSDSHCLCLPGYYFDRNSVKCVPCDVGSFKVDASDASACTPCEDFRAFSTTVANASTSSADCLCGMGRYLESELCAACGWGRYKEYIGNSACRSCLHGQTTVSVVSISPDDCVCGRGFGV